MDEEKIVNVYSSGDKLETDRLVAALKENGIDSFIQNAATQDLFGLGRLGTGYNLAIGIYNIQIRESDYEQSIKIIKEQLGLNDEEIQEEDAGESEMEQTESSDEETAPTSQQVKNYDWARSVLLSIFWLFGIGSAAGIFFGIKGYKSKPVFSLIGIVTGILGLIFTIIYFEALWGFLLLITVVSIPVFLAVYGFVRYRKTGKPLYLIAGLTGCLLLIGLLVLPLYLHI